jgi:hypothetical protein
VLQRTYEEDDSPYPDANYIAADSNIDSKGNFTSIFFNRSTSCATTIGALDKCSWFFLQEISINDVPEGFYGAHGWM